MNPRGGWIHDEVGPVKNWARTTAWPTFCPKPGRERERGEERLSQQGQTNFLVTFTGLLHTSVCVRIEMSTANRNKYPSPPPNGTQKGGTT